MKIRKFDDKTSRFLLSRGVSPQDLPPKSLKEGDVEESVTRIEYISQGMPTRSISVARQLKTLTSLEVHPLHGSYTVGLSSFPTDIRAKHVAQYLMVCAWKQHLALQNKQGKAPPLWHNIYGSLGDTLRDKSEDRPCFLVLNNVNIMSTNLKLEKLRDLLVMYHDIPKLVITGGDPACILFTTKIFLPLRESITFGPPNRIRDE